MSPAVSDTLVPVASIIASLLRYAAGVIYHALTGRLSSLCCHCLAGQPLVTLLLQLVRQIGAASLDDLPLVHHMHDIRRDVVEDALVVRDDEHAQVRATQRVDTIGDDLERVDVQAGVGLVEDGVGRLQHRHLQHLGALLLAAGEAVVEVAVDEGAIHLEQLHLLGDQLAKLGGRDALLQASPIVGSKAPKLAKATVWMATDTANTRYVYMAGGRPKTDDIDLVELTECIELLFVSLKSRARKR